MGANNTRPYKVFGEKLRFLRERARESLLEVSGAVEIDHRTLEQIEAGAQLPEEDVLMLLINHFDVKDHDAVNLWELAGYSKISDKEQTLNEEQLLKQVMMVIPLDNKVAFSDTAHVSANNNGVVVDFALSAGNFQPQTVSRVGMSVEQARVLAEQLKNKLDDLNKPKVIHALPMPKHNSNTDKKKRS